MLCWHQKSPNKLNIFRLLNRSLQQTESFCSGKRLVQRNHWKPNIPMDFIFMMSLGKLLIAIVGVMVRCSKSFGHIVNFKIPWSRKMVRVNNVRFISLQWAKINEFYVVTLICGKISNCVLHNLGIYYIRIPIKYKVFSCVTIMLCWLLELIPALASVTFCNENQKSNF